MRSTAEWEALLDGWVYDKQSDTLLGSWVRSTQIRKQEQAAPEAVAEVVGLRRELEERVRIWQKVAEKLENRGDKDGASQARHTVAVVTRILEGTHE